MSGFIGDSFPSMLGGGIPGGQPKGGLLGGGATGGRSGSSGMEGGGQRGSTRATLIRMMGNTTFPHNNPQIITPFRRYFNLGDTAGSFNSAPSPLLGRPINQVGGNSMVSRLHANAGGTAEGSAFYSGNQKFVSDSSDYIKYRKLSANNKNYNDSSFGGENGSTVSQALRRVRS
jgi:hypothetical protein